MGHGFCMYVGMRLTWSAGWVAALVLAWAVPASAGPECSTPKVGAGASVPKYRIPASSEKPSPVILPRQMHRSGTAESVHDLVLPGRVDPNHAPRALIVPGAAKPGAEKRLIVPHAPGDPSKLVVAQGRGTRAVVRALAENGDFRELRQFWDGPHGALAGNPALNRGGRRELSPGTVRRATALWGRDVQREVRVNGNDPKAPIVARVEGGPRSHDPVVNETFDTMGAVHAMYRTQFGRRSVHGDGQKLVSVIGQGNGAFHRPDDGSVRIGRGDGVKHRAWNEPAIVGHEFTHAVTHATANFGRMGQPAVLNEHFSDVMGIVLEHWMKGVSVDKANWVHGVNTIAPGAPKSVTPVRSMSSPRSIEKQPQHMAEYVDNPVAIYKNVGIPNRAFYGAAMRMGGGSWEAAGKIWYVTLRDRMRPDSTFQDAARWTVHVAGELYGVGSRQQKAVIAGWNDVGMKVRAGSAPPAPRTP